MSRKNYHAYTSEGVNYPAYISVNAELNGQVSITVRTQGESTGSTIYLSPEQIEHLATDMIAGINGA